MKAAATHYYQVVGVIKSGSGLIYRAFGRYPDVLSMRNAAERWAQETANVIGYIMKRRAWREVAQ